MAGPTAPVPCAGCSRPLGVARSAQGGIFCSPLCGELPTSSMAYRNALIEALAKRTDMSYGLIGLEFDISRQRVEQIVNTGS